MTTDPCIALPPQVLIREVGLRDGGPCARTFLPRADTCRWVDALVAAGLREIDLGPFGPAAVGARQAAATALVHHARAHPGLTVTALVPDCQGAEAALRAGVHKLTIPVSASEAHARAHGGRSSADMVDVVRAVARLRDAQAPHVPIEVAMTTAFGCALQGRVPADDVLRLALACVAAGAAAVGLSDTAGMAHPAQVRQLFTRLRAELGSHAGAAHLLDTRGLGLANCLAASDVGVRVFQASMGGGGGCSPVPGVGGNVVAEDLVFMFDAMGLSTGMDLPGLISAREIWAADLPGEPLRGTLPLAGVPRGWDEKKGEPEPAPRLPCAGIRVVEFTHMVMGPACGMVLADLGAEVIKVEPVGHGREGDATRYLLGAGAGFFPMFNRNKKSLALDLLTPAGHEAALRLVATADVLVENFKPGTMDKLGLDEATLRALNPRLVYVSHKGFLPGPYDHRTALDEVVQMMGGLAYMTGRPGDPLRAGASVNDIMGGMFGAIGAMAALAQRDHPVHGTGQGQVVQSALFENNVLLVAQHMMQFTVTGQPADPMPARISAWAIYDVFQVRGGEQIFLAVVSDSAWEAFCQAFGFDDWRSDERLGSNNDRVRARDWLIPVLRERLVAYSASELAAVFEAHALPFAPITRPQDLLQDPHLQATGGLAPITLPDGRPAQAVLLPLTLAGQRPGVRLSPPRLGEHSVELLSSLGYRDSEIEAMLSIR